MCRKSLFLMVVVAGCHEEAPGTPAADLAATVDAASAADLAG